MGSKFYRWMDGWQIFFLLTCGGVFPSLEIDVFLFGFLFFYFKFLFCFLSVFFKKMGGGGRANAI